MTKILVAGAGGAIGGHLVNSLLNRGFEVRAADIKHPQDWWQYHSDAENVWGTDLSDNREAEIVTQGVDQIYMLAADMGGMGFIENNKTRCMLSVLISTHMLRAAMERGVQRYFYSSSACVYAADRQTATDVTALKESDAYPADAEDGYGWEKLFSERMCRHFREDFGFRTRVARYHNVYGPHGSWRGGREKAPAALIRKVIEAGPDGEIDIWGDGEQTRSFMYVDDCVKGTQMIMEGDYEDPINLGSSELVSINQLVTAIEEIAGHTVVRRYDLTKPQGVRGRNSDNSEILSHFDWEPSTPLQVGLERTYAWIHDEMTKEI